MFDLPYIQPEQGTDNINSMSYNNKDVIRSTSSSGRWTDEEHELFLQGLKLYNKNWKKLASLIKTRTVVQVRTHAQKYFGKLGKDSQEYDFKDQCQKRSLNDEDLLSIGDDFHAKKPFLVPSEISFLDDIQNSVFNNNFQKLSRTASAPDVCQATMFSSNNNNNEENDAWPPLTRAYTMPISIHAIPHEQLNSTTSIYAASAPKGLGLVSANQSSFPSFAPNQSTSNSQHSILSSAPMSMSVQQKRISELCSQPHSRMIPSFLDLDPTRNIHLGIRVDITRADDPATSNDNPLAYPASTTTVSNSSSSNNHSKDKEEYSSIVCLPINVSVEMFPKDESNGLLARHQPIKTTVTTTEFQPMTMTQPQLMKQQVQDVTQMHCSPNFIGDNTMSYNQNQSFDCTLQNEHVARDASESYMYSSQLQQQQLLQQYSHNQQVGDGDGVGVGKIIVSCSGNDLSSDESIDEHLAAYFEMDDDFMDILLE